MNHSPVARLGQALACCAVFASTTCVAAISRFYPDGTYLGQFVVPNDGYPGVEAITVVNGEAWIGQDATIAPSILKYHFDRSSAGSVGSRRSAAIAVVGNEVWIGGTGSGGGISRYYPDGTFLGNIAVSNDGYSGVEAITVVNGEVWIGQDATASPLIQKYRFDGTLVGSVASRRAAAISIVGNEVWVGGTGSGSGMSRYYPDGTYLGYIPTFNDGYGGVEAITVVFGQVWVGQDATANPMIQRFNFDGSMVGTIASGRAAAITVVGNEVWVGGTGVPAPSTPLVMMCGLGWFIRRHRRNQRSCAL